jgi:hypothetical protein
MIPVLHVVEQPPFVVTIAAEAASIGIPACWMINVVDAKGRARNAVRIAGEPASGVLSPSPHLLLVEFVRRRLVQ